MLKLKAAFWAPVPYWWLIVIAGSGPMLLATGLAREAMVLAWIMARLIHLFILGRILSQVQPGRVSSFGGIISEYGVPYVVTGLIIGVVYIALSLAGAALLAASIPVMVFGGIGQGIVAVAALYVWPLVFLKRTSLAAILAGVPFLFRNLKPSLWIIGIVIVGQTLETGGPFLYVVIRSGWAFGVMLIAGVVSSYVAAVTFAAALHYLLRVRWV